MRTFTFGLTPEDVIREQLALTNSGDDSYEITCVMGSMDEQLIGANVPVGVERVPIDRRAVWVLTNDQVVELLANLREEWDSENPEDERECAGSLRSSILQTIGIEEI